MASRGYSQAAGPRLLGAAASLSEHRLGCSWASVVAAHRRSSCGTRAAQHVESSRIRDGTRVSGIGRQVLYHRAAREAPQGIFNSCHESPMGGRVPAERWECASSLSPVSLLRQGTSQKEASQAQFGTTRVESPALDPTRGPRGLLLNLAVKGHVWTQKPFLVKIDLSFGSG